MFTGIVICGSVTQVDRSEEELRITVEAPFGDLELGESVAVDGACLTVVDTGSGWFAVQAVAATRARTRLADVEPNDRVNVERALAVGDRLGGHLVQGHVDGLAEVTSVRPDGDALIVEFELPGEVAAVTVPQGSLTVNGVSLTVSTVPQRGRVQVSLIPYTRDHTTLGTLQPGDRVNVEGDLIGKYVRQLLEARH